MPAQTSPFRGFRLMGVFLYFGAVMATLAGVTLIWRGTFLDDLWILNLCAYHQLSPLGITAGIGFLSLGAILGVAGAGWSRRRFWGWALAAVVIATQVPGKPDKRHQRRSSERQRGIRPLRRASLFSSSRRGPGGFHKAAFLMARVSEGPNGSAVLERFNTGFDLLDIATEKCEHSNLLGSQTHT